MKITFKLIKEFEKPIISFDGGSSQIIVANKMDMFRAKKNLKSSRRNFGNNYDSLMKELHRPSRLSLAHQGLDNLLEVNGSN